MRKHVKRVAPLVVEYPWDDWFSEPEGFALVRGVDFECAPHVMAGQIRNKAPLYTRDGKPFRVSIRVMEDTLYVMFKDKERK